MNGNMVTELHLKGLVPNHSYSEVGVYEISLTAYSKNEKTQSTFRRKVNVTGNSFIVG